MLEFSDANFDKEVVQADLPVLVDFWATWCMPCLKIAPIVDELAKQYSGKIKIGRFNVENSQKVPQQFGIRSIPTLLIFKNGKVVSQIIGLQPKGRLEEKIVEVI